MQGILQPTATSFWPMAPKIQHSSKRASDKKANQQAIDQNIFSPVTGDLRQFFESEGNNQGLRKNEDWLQSVEKNAFWQAVDAIRAHASWQPATQSQPNLFGQATRELDGRLIVELSWIFGAEGGAPLPFEAAADAMDIDPGRFRRICQRAFPEECAWIEANVGPLQGV